MLPCICSPITGCGHQMTWHRDVKVVNGVNVARCLVPGCGCEVEGCSHSEDDDGVTDAAIAAELGVML